MRAAEKPLPATPTPTQPDWDAVSCSARLGKDGPLKLHTPPRSHSLDDKQLSTHCISDSSNTGRAADNAGGQRRKDESGRRIHGAVRNVAH